MNIENYKNRLIEIKLDNYLKVFGAVCIEGPKWCGKTWTAVKRSESQIYLGDSTDNFQNRELALINPNLIFEGSIPKLIDEWQEVPSLWDAVRSRVDFDTRKGQFILTGSATPNKKGVLHSGIGRIGTLKMRPMSLYESGDSTGEVSLKDICSRKFNDLIINEASVEELAHLIIRGGWPANVNSAKDLAKILPASYIDLVIKEDFNRIDFVKKDLRKMTLLLKSLARNECTLVSNKKLIDDIKGEENISIDEETLAGYLNIYEQVFIVDNVEPYSLETKSSLRMKQKKKRRFIDPSLTAALLNLNEKKLIEDLNTFGFLFESMVLRDLIVYAETFDAKIYHYNDYNNSEVDAVIELDDGSWCAFEIKLGAGKVEEAATNLIKVKNKIEKINRTTETSKIKVPSVLCVITGTGKAAYLRPDGVYVVPITALKN